MLESLEEYGYDAHSVIMARGDKIFAEAYYAPYDENSLHRMYSVSKSFIAVAVGTAIDDGLLSIDDKLVDLLADFSPDLSDELLAHVTVRVIDTFLGKVIFNLGFDGDDVSIVSTSHAQRILQRSRMRAVGKMI